MHDYSIYALLWAGVWSTFLDVCPCCFLLKKPNGRNVEKKEITDGCLSVNGRKMFLRDYLIRYPCYPILEKFPVRLITIKA